MDGGEVDYAAGVVSHIVILFPAVKNWSPTESTEID